MTPELDEDFIAKRRYHGQITTLSQFVSEANDGKIPEVAELQASYESMRHSISSLPQTTKDAILVVQEKLKLTAERIATLRERAADDPGSVSTRQKLGTAESEHFHLRHQHKLLETDGVKGLAQELEMYRRQALPHSYWFGHLPEITRQESSTLDSGLLKQLQALVIARYEVNPDGPRATAQRRTLSTRIANLQQRLKSAKSFVNPCDAANEYRAAIRSLRQQRRRTASMSGGGGETDRLDVAIGEAKEKLAIASERCMLVREAVALANGRS